MEEMMMQDQLLAAIIDGYNNLNLFSREDILLMLVLVETHLKIGLQWEVRSQELSWITWGLISEVSTSPHINMWNRVTLNFPRQIPTFTQCWDKLPMFGVVLSPSKVVAMMASSKSRMMLREQPSSSTITSEHEIYKKPLSETVYIRLMF